MASSLPLLLQGLGLLLVGATLVPFSHSHAGIVRSFDFPRLQIAVALAVTLAALLATTRDGPSLAVAAALVAALAIQMRHILPFTPLGKKPVKDARPEDGANDLSLLVANVLESNRDTAAVLACIERADPDLVLLLETDARWQAAMAPLRARYPHAIEKPQDNTYGLLFYARRPLRNTEIRFLLQPDVPSLRTEIQLPDGEWILFHGVHPRPPCPGHSSAPRDAELVVVAREIHAQDRPTIVAGDLNDVAWSRTTTLFQNISGLLDPREGRGFYPTFHARLPFLRWPLDHVFFSEHFLLRGLRRLSYVGSDHFPILVVLRRAARGEAVQEAPKADGEDFAKAQETLAAGRAEAAFHP